ncbi:hypothetical protein T4B_152, partial [Trichinella pseudospiralis]
MNDYDCSLATPSAPHYFYFNCCFNIKTFSYCSEDFNFDYSSHGSVLFICTQQVMEDSNMFTSICDEMQCESIKELDAENKCRCPNCLYGYYCLLIWILHVSNVTPNRMRSRNDGVQCVLVMELSVMACFL